MKSSASGRSVRKIMVALWVVLWPLLLALHLYPIRVGYIRLLLVFGCALLWSGALWLCWKTKPLRFASWFVTIGFVVFLLLPGKSDDAQQLRAAFVQSLKSYDGTPYVWGGESRLGIDCSGLIRCGLIDANLRRGWQERNPASLRRAFSLWWNDSSALAMKQGFRGDTRRLFSTQSLNETDDARLQSGDIAVTQSGAHVLAYIGDRTWIEADPSALTGDKVIQVRTPTRNAWFNSPMTILRWRELE